MVSGNDATKIRTSSPYKLQFSPAPWVSHGLNSQVKVSRGRKLWNIRESFSDTDYLPASTPNMGTNAFSNLLIHCSQWWEEVERYGWEQIWVTANMGDSHPFLGKVKVMYVFLWTLSFIKLYLPLATETFETFLPSPCPLILSIFRQFHSFHTSLQWVLQGTILGAYRVIF